MAMNFALPSEEPDEHWPGCDQHACVEMYKRRALSILGDVGDTQILLLSRTHWGNVWDMTRHSDLQQQRYRNWSYSDTTALLKNWVKSEIWNEVHTYNKNNNNEGKENTTKKQIKLRFWYTQLLLLSNYIPTFIKQERYRKQRQLKKTRWKAKFAALNNFVNACFWLKATA